LSSKQIAVRDYASAEYAVLRESDTVAHLRHLVVRTGQEMFPVVDDEERPIGSVSVKDIAWRMLLGGPEWRIRPIDGMLVGEFVQRNVKAVPADTPLQTAVRRLVESEADMLFVIEPEGGLLVFSYEEGLHAAADLLPESVLAREAMVAETPSVRPMHSIRRVIDVMNESSTKRVLVMDGDLLVGIITPRDVLMIEPYGPAAIRRRRFVRGRKYGRETGVSRGRRVLFVPIAIAEDVMSSPVISVKEDTPARTVAQILAERHIGAVPVLDERGKPIGFVTRESLTRQLVGL